ncbi:MAG: DUF86 domain-containing protein [Chloroflexota bacterium]
MTEMERNLTYLEDILQAAIKTQEFIQGIAYKEFLDDEKTIFAVVRALEIVGEATKKLPGEFRQTYPDMPWRSMAGMRNKLIHDYASVEPLVVWKTVKNDVPDLIPGIKTIISELKSQ